MDASASRDRLALTPTFADRGEAVSWAEEHDLDSGRFTELLDELHVQESSGRARQELASLIRPAFPGARSEDLANLVERLRLNTQEIDRRQGWLSTIGGVAKGAFNTVWNVVTFPVRRPGTTLLILAGIAAGLAYYYRGMGRSLLEYLPDFSGSVRRVGESASPALPEGLGMGGTGVFGVPAPTAEVVPAPVVDPPPMGTAGERIR